MKKLPIIICVLIGNVFTSFSQMQFNFKAGISPGANPRTNDLIVNRQNPREEFSFNMVHVKPQFYGGIVASLELRSPFFAEAGLTYTEKSSSYQVNYRMARELNPANQVMNETEKILQLPVNIGVHLGPIDFISGWTAMKTISQKNEMTHVRGFSESVNRIKLGWQSGVRYSFRKVLLGVEYQGALNVVGQDMSVNGQCLGLLNVPGKLVLSIQYAIQNK